MRFSPLRLFPLLLTGGLLAAPALAQPSGPSPFAPFELPAPNGYRLGSGAPGPAYWQQQADYEIDVALDPATHRLSGTVRITYTNNAPVALDYLWLQLDQNLFQPGSEGAAMQPSDSRWRGSFSAGGYTLSRVEVVRDGRRTTPARLVHDTTMRLDLAEPLPGGGGQLQIEIDYAFVVPAYGADRMGRFEAEAGTVYQIAQWYPRMFVYDDVRGWNVMPYLGQGEFYLEFGTFDVAITVPHDLTVVATGVLQNPDEVLTAEQRLRLERARRSRETVMIVERGEVGTPEARPAAAGTLTWRYRAEDVRDFAWAASRAFIWDAAGWNDVLIQSAYPAEGLTSGDGRPGWERATQFGRHAIEYYSETWFPYPYPVAISVAGVVGGMEYPMIHFSSVHARDQALSGVIDHELGHNWFPMVVASDERRYAWMDEGFTTFINHGSNLAYYGENATRAERLSAGYIVGKMQEAIADQPVYTFPDQVRRGGLGFLAYRKPGKGLQLLRDYVLGPERFDPAFRAYIERWAFKHPQPADFYRTIEDVAGAELGWFWHGWFHTTDRLDQAVTAERVGEATRVRLENREGLVMPVVLEVGYADGQTERLRMPVHIWAGDGAFVTVLPGEVVRLTLDPEGHLPDLDRTNNVWTAPGVAPSRGR